MQVSCLYCELLTSISGGSKVKVCVCVCVCVGGGGGGVVAEPLVVYKSGEGGQYKNLGGSPLLSPPMTSFLEHSLECIFRNNLVKQ